MDQTYQEIGERTREAWTTDGSPFDSDRADRLEVPRTARTELEPSWALAHLLADAAPEFSHVCRAVLNASPAAIHVKDTRGRYLLVNRRFEALHKVSLDRPGYLTDDDLLPPELAAARRANDRDVIASGQPLEVEEVVPDAEGTGQDRTYVTLLFPVARPCGSPYAVGGICTDVTDQRSDQRCLVIQHSVSLALAESMTSTDAGSAVLQAICRTVGWDVGLLWRADPVANQLRCVESWNAPCISAGALERMSRGMTLSRGVGLAGRVWATGRPVWIENVVVADNFPRAAAALQDGLHGACGFPIRDGAEVVGVIEFFARGLRRPDCDLTRVMTDIGGQFNQFIESQRVQRVLLQRDREFALARTIQLGLLPPRSPIVAGIAIAGASCPAQETGGDYFDYIPSPDGSLGIAIGDASGHGIGAALVIAETRAYLRARAATDSDVGQILTFVNRHLAGDMPDGHFVTLFLARLDGPTRTLTYSSAGHTPGFVLDDRGEVRLTLRSTNFPLGVDREADFPPEPPVVLGPGEIVLLLTDGIHEACSPDGKPFGFERALAAVRAYRGDTPDGTLTALLRAVRTFSPTAPVDDMTAIVIKVDGQAEMKKVPPDYAAIPDGTADRRGAL